MAAAGRLRICHTRCHTRSGPLLLYARPPQVAAEQPKAAGSSLLAALTHRLAADALEVAGLAEVGQALVLPLATGMALTTALLALRGLRPPTARCVGVCECRGLEGRLSVLDMLPKPCTCPPRMPTRRLPSAACIPAILRRYVLWPRIDQKTCLKCVQAAGYEPVVVPLRLQGDQLCTDVEALEAEVARLGPDAVACVLTTTSCFAPRAADDVVAGAGGDLHASNACEGRGAACFSQLAEGCDAHPPLLAAAAVAKLCQRAGIAHIINNAYGVQSAALCAQVSGLEHAARPARP